MGDQLNIDLLKKRLRDDISKTRYEAMRVLAGTGTYDAVQELIQVANGGLRRVREGILYRGEVEKPHWWSREIIRQIPYTGTINEYFTLYDQLKAVESLGESGSESARKYLEDLIEFSPNWEINGDGSHDWAGSDNCAHRFTGFYFPNSHYPLKQELEQHEYDESRIREPWISFEPYEAIYKADYPNSPGKNYADRVPTSQAFVVLQKAVQRIKETAKRA